LLPFFAVSKRNTGMFVLVKRIVFNVLSALRYTLAGLFSFLLGGMECEVCGKTCIALPLCFDCRKKFFSVPAIDSGLCKVCGKTLISEHGLCLACRSAPTVLHTDGIFPLFSYRLWNTRILSAWKRNDERILSHFFAERLSRRLMDMKKCFGEFCLVPVPPRYGKIHKRGWDQVEELCAFLEYEYGFSVLNVLQRVLETEQKKLDRRQRLSTIGKSYALTKDAARSALPERVCIIDDVMTTGATLESCAAALKNAGVKTVFAATLFTVD